MQANSGTGPLLLGEEQRDVVTPLVQPHALLISLTTATTKVMSKHGKTKKGEGITSMDTRGERVNRRKRLKKHDHYLQQPEIHQCLWFIINVPLCLYVLCLFSVCVPDQGLFACCIWPWRRFPLP